MKVTAIISDDLIQNVRTYTGSRTITGAITIALKDWLDIYHIKELNNEIAKSPISIKNRRKIRRINRKI